MTNIQKIIEKWFGNKWLEEFANEVHRSAYNQALEEIEREVEKLKKYHKEFECRGLYEDFCEDQNCENAPKEYNQGISDVINFIQSKKENI